MKGEVYRNILNSNFLEENEPEFLKDAKFVEFLESKNIDLSKYKEDFVEIWNIPSNLYVGFHNSFSFSFSKDKVERDLKASLIGEQGSNQDKLIHLLIKLIATLEHTTVGQLLKVFREIKRDKNLK